MLISCASPVNWEKAKLVQVTQTFLPDVTDEVQARHRSSLESLTRTCEEVEIMDYKCDIPPFDFRYNLGGYEYCVEKAREYTAEKGADMLELAGIYKNLFGQYDMSLYGTLYKCQ